MGLMRNTFKLMEHVLTLKAEMDTLGIEPRASRMLSGCDTTTPCAHGGFENLVFPIIDIDRYFRKDKKSLTPPFQETHFYAMGI